MVSKTASTSVSRLASRSFSRQASWTASRAAAEAMVPVECLYRTATICRNVYNAENFYSSRISIMNARKFNISQSLTLTRISATWINSIRYSTIGERILHRYIQYITLSNEMFRVFFSTRVIDCLHSLVLSSHHWAPRTLPAPKAT